MKKILQKIANLLIINIQNVENLGLLNGKMGIAVFLYYYARNASQPAYRDQADDLLDELFDTLNMGNTPPLLANSVASIGLGLNYLIKNHFIETDENPDELFKDTDMRLFRDFNKQFMSDFPVFSAGFYALSRIKTKNRTVPKNNLISSLLNCIAGVYANEKLVQSPMFTNSVIYFLNGVYDYGMYRTKVKKTLKPVLSYVLNTIQTTTYRFTDADILQNLLSSINSCPAEVNDIQLYLDQLNLSPANDSEVDVIVKDLQQYLFYSDFDCPYHSISFIEKYIDDQIKDPFSINLLALAYIGMHIMGLNLS